jgi:DUF971 family protein
MKLKTLSRLDSSTLKLMWDDGHAGIVPLKALRDSCPCAGCQGETVLLHHYAPAPEENPHPEKYHLKGAEPVGSYALKLVWGDGHEQGLYTWEHLRALCCCEECTDARSRDSGEAAH